MIEYYQLTPTLKISRILTGLWQIADMERGGNTLDPHATAQHLGAYIGAGFNTFDMADHYGSAEVIAGAFNQKRRIDQEAHFFTKWVPSPPVTSKKVARAAVERSLERLQTDTIDLFQYHAWQYSNPEWLDTLFWLQELKEEGLIKHIGVTNFDAAHLNMACASGIEIVSNQISYSIIDQRACHQMSAVCAAHGISILAYGTLCGGLLSEKWLDKADPTSDEDLTWSQMKYLRFINVAGGWAVFQKVLKTLHGVAKKHKCSIANVTSRYILDQAHVAGIILGARLGRSEHIQENTRVFSLAFSETDNKIIREAQSMLRPISGNCGDEYRHPPFLTASGDLSHHLDELPKVYDVIEQDGVMRIDSGTPWEQMAGYARAIRKGNRIMVSGTTATHGSKLIGGDDAAAQTHFIIDKIQASITSLGGSLKDIVRTRIFISDVDDWEKVAHAHGERFAKIRPANTMVQAGLIGEGYKVEIEAEAIIDDDKN